VQILICRQRQVIQVEGHQFGEAQFGVEQQPGDGPAAGYGCWTTSGAGPVNVSGSAIVTE
jgi:hypothetical protein